jgi:hypothetical protein
MQMPCASEATDEIERLREALEDYQGRYSAQTTNPADQQTPMTHKNKKSAEALADPGG